MKKVYFISVIIIFSLWQMFSFAEKGSKAKEIHYSSINQSNNVIIGSLGKPLGKIIIIEGVILDGDSTGRKEDSGQLLLKVQKVDGKELPKPVIIDYKEFSWAKVKEIKTGSPFKYIGYETGEMTGIPDQAFKYLPRVATKSYGFSVYFQLCKEIK